MLKHVPFLALTAFVAVGVDAFAGIGVARPFAPAKRACSAPPLRLFPNSPPWTPGNGFADDDKGDDSSTVVTKSGKTARRDIKDLLENNKRWIERKKSQDPTFFDKLGTTHKPAIYWLGDADARVAANEIIGAEPGEVFVHRNIGNIVVDTDSNLMSGLQYAVDVLEVDHIIVCGHYQSGAVAQALSTTDFASPLENWLSHIRYVYRLHQEELSAISDKRSLQRRLVELNVVEQCLNIYRLAVVQRKRYESSRTKPFATPRIFGVVYDCETGLLTRLKWVPEGLEEKYGLYQGLADPSGDLARRLQPEEKKGRGAVLDYQPGSMDEAPPKEEPRRKSFWGKLLG